MTGQQVNVPARHIPALLDLLQGARLQPVASEGGAGPEGTLLTARLYDGLVRLKYERPDGCEEYASLDLTRRVGMRRQPVLVGFHLRDDQAGRVLMMLDELGGAA